MMASEKTSTRRISSQRSDSFSLPESSRKLFLGEVIDGKYRLERRIAEGGMGVVFSATHVELEHRVAIKFIRQELSQSNDVVTRFLNEARASAQLASDHIARVLDAGRIPPGVPYLVMEYLLGEDLGTVVERRGALPPHEVADYLLQTCEALAVAHAAGIVHRDIKPENLFLTTDNADRPLLKVLDFGISKRLIGDPSDGLTHPGTSLGSPEYMSPEQMSGHRVDARTDIWSLGVVMYELLTGQRPFEGRSIAEVCAAVLRDPSPRPSRLQRGIDPALDRIVARCLQKEPASRYVTVAELALDLERFAAAEPTPSQRAAAALGLRPSVRVQTRSMSDETFHPVVIPSLIPSLDPAPRRALSKRATLMLAAVSSSFVLAAGLASSAEFAERVRMTSQAAGFQSMAEPVMLNLRALTDGWLTPAALGPDVIVDDTPARGRTTDVMLPRSVAIAAEFGRAAPPSVPADLGQPEKAAPRRHGRGKNLSAAEVRDRYQTWLRGQGLTRLSELEQAGAGPETTLAKSDAPSSAAASVAVAADPPSQSAATTAGAEPPSTAP